MFKQSINGILIIALVVISLLFLRQCDNIEYIKQVNTANVTAMSDTVKIVKLKNQQLEYQKTLFIASEENLKELNKELYKELQKEKDDIKYISKITVKYKTDTVSIKNNLNILQDSSFSLKWEYRNNIQYINTESFFHIDSLNIIHADGTKIYTNNIHLDLITGITKVEGLHKIFVRTKDDIEEVTFDIEGAILDEKLFKHEPNQFNLGVYVGTGISSSLNGDKVLFGWSVGLGITYTLYSF